MLSALMGLFLLSGAATAATPALPSYSVALTGYNAVPGQTDDDPFVTASGAYSNPQVVAARSQDLADELPFGTIIEVDGPSTSDGLCGHDIVAPIVGYRVIADTMNARYTNRIDILFSTKSNYIMADGKVKNAANVLGICGGATIRVVGFIDITHPNRLPKTQADLAAIVRGDNSLALK
jgi:3D (Asp-Asp-Asp) domain-containing protein